MNKLFFFFIITFLTSISLGVVNDADKAQFGREANIVSNGGFENGLAGWGRYSEAAENCTFTDTGDLVNATAHGFSQGDIIVFTSITSTTGISTNTVYYVRSVTANTFQVASTASGSALALTTNGSGQFKRGQPFSASGGSPSITISTTTTTPIEGKASGILTKDAAVRIGEGWFTSFTVPANASGSFLNFSLAYHVSSGTYAANDAFLYIFDDTNDAIVHRQALTHTSSTVKQYVSGGFLAGATSYKVVIHVASASSSSYALEIDSIRIWNPAASIMNVSQASFVGESYIASTTNCQWTRSSTTVGAFGTDADCPGPTIVKSYIGSWQITDSDLPRQTINNLPPGEYEVTIIANVAMSTAQNMSLAISDGTTTCEPQGGNANSAGSVGVSVTCSFTYTTSGNRFFELYAGSPSVTVNLNNNVTGPRASLKFIVKRFPTSSELAVNPSQTANSWSGYHANTCTWARTNTALGAPTDDATCSLVESTNQNFGTVSTSGSVSPAITFTPSRAGRYYVCANTGLSTTATNAILTGRLTDGTTVIAESQVRSYNGGGGIENGPFISLCGVYVASTTASRTLSIQTASSTGAVNLGSASVARGAIEWSIFQIDQSFPAPVLVGSVTSGSSGALRLDSASVTAAGVVTELGGSDWINGNCSLATSKFTCNFQSGTFSAAPQCQVTLNVDPGSAVSGSITSISSSSVIVETNNTAGASAIDFNLLCIGAR
jgi:hypothetical protein